MIVLLGVLYLIVGTHAKWVEGKIDTKEKWAFLSRFCFLSLDGQFEYVIEYEKDMGTPNLLLYYDDNSQWPSVYHSSKTCKEREAVLNKAGQNQIIKLSHWYPDTEISGCVLTRANKELPASKSSTSQPTTTKQNLPKPKSNSTTVSPHPSYYDQFLKPTTPTPKTTSSTILTNSTTWFELIPTDDWNSTTVIPEEELWEHVGQENSTNKLEKLKDVEILFDNQNGSSHKIKRSTNELIQRYRRRRLNFQNSEHNQNGASNEKTERLVVSCHNSRRFRSARERWWFIAISNCDSPKGLEVKYKFLMTNGDDGDFWREHFSADEFYVLPVLLSYTFAYIIVMIAIVMCSVELKSRHLLHSTYKLYLISACAQHVGVILQTIAYLRYAVNGIGNVGAKVTGQFICGIAEMTFLLLLLLLSKGYTVTRGRLKVGFTVKLTVFMCAYIVTYIVLFVYQAKAFDPGEVLYLYESPAGYGLIVMRITAWCVFAYSTFFTVRKFPEKNMFYCPFFICGTLWFYAGPLFILTANSYIDKWVRESVVTAVLLFITFSGHIMFLLLTLPVFANKNFPYHVRTTQIGVMEVRNSSGLDSFGHNPYQPTNGASQTVIIPLTRRTEELIGNMYNQYMATAPPLSLENEISKLNGLPKRLDSISPKNKLLPQDSTETNSSDDIKPSLKKEFKDNKEIFTVESQISKMEPAVLPVTSKTVEKSSNATNGGKNLLLGASHLQNGIKNLPMGTTNLPNGSRNLLNGNFEELPSLKSRRNLLEPIKRDEPPPSWSLAKGPCVIAMQRKTTNIENEESPEKSNGSLHQNGKKVPPVRNGLQASSGEISTILEGRVQNYNDSTVRLFTAQGMRKQE